MSERRRVLFLPEEILKEIGAQFVFGEWRFPFYGKDSVAEMLPVKEWLARRRQTGHSYVQNQETIRELLEVVQSSLNMCVELSRTMDDDHWYKSDLRNLTEKLEIVFKKVSSQLEQKP